MQADQSSSTIEMLGIMGNCRLDTADFHPAIEGGSSFTDFVLSEPGSETAGLPERITYRSHRHALRHGIESGRRRTIYSHQDGPASRSFPESR